jgi:endonuclease YncB( thermonuclease family)
MRGLAALVILVFAAAGLLFGLDTRDRVWWVSDGDTLKILGENLSSRTIRVYGVDCPESKQPHGLQAWAATAVKCFGRQVYVNVLDRDRYGREVAQIHVDTTDLGAWLVAEGHAWVYKRYCSALFCGRYLYLENRARSRRMGLWSAKAPVAPWDWRRAN